MKKIITGGFFALIGSVWLIAISFWTHSDLVSSWSNPPGRFLTTLAERGMMFWFVIALIFLLFGIVLMLIECFRKDK